jgi:hypothetical protein
MQANQISLVPFPPPGGRGRPGRRIRPELVTCEVVVMVSKVDAEVDPLGVMPGGDHVQVVLAGNPVELQLSSTT